MLRDYGQIKFMYKTLGKGAKKPKTRVPFTFTLFVVELWFSLLLSLC